MRCHYFYSGKFRGVLCLALVIASILLSGCSAPSNPSLAGETLPADTPVPSVTPAAGSDSPVPSFDASSATPVPIDELDGVAEPGDVLPQFSSYEEAKKTNPDVIGWISVPNTRIDYPVVRTDDNEYYLTHNVEKEESKHGAVFMDFRNSNSDQQRHIILYGHNMKNGTMFHDLNNYKQRSFFEENRIITFLWDGKETKWEVYAAYVVKQGVYYIHTRFGSDDNYVEYMNSIIDYAKESKYSVVDDTVSIKASDQVLTLSTCTYEYDNSYFAVCARRIQ